MGCTCGIVRLDAKEVGRNWSPNCVTHGYGSNWYNSEEQILKRSRDRARLKELQLKASDARKKVKENIDTDLESINTDFLL